MGGWFGGLDASALIDGHIYDHGPRHHGFEHVAGDEMRRFRTRDEHGTDHKVHRLDVFTDVARGGEHGGDILRHDVVQVTQTVQVHIHDEHIGAHTGCDLGRVHAHDSAAEHENVGGWNTWNATEEDTASALGFLKVLGSFLDRHPSGHFRHRDKQWQRAIGFLNGFVRDGDAFGGHHGFGELLLSRKVEIGEQDLSFAHERILTGDGLLHFHDHFGFRPDVFDIVDNRRSGVDIGGIWKTASVPCSFFHKNGMSVADQFNDASRNEGDAVFVGFDFFGYSDDHSSERCRR